MWRSVALYKDHKRAPTSQNPQILCLQKPLSPLFFKGWHTQVLCSLLRSSAHLISSGGNWRSEVKRNSWKQSFLISSQWESSAPAWLSLLAMGVWHLHLVVQVLRLPRLWTGFWTRCLLICFLTQNHMRICSKSCPRQLQTKPWVARGKTGSVSKQTRWALPYKRLRPAIKNKSPILTRYPYWGWDLGKVHTQPMFIIISHQV